MLGIILGVGYIAIGVIGLVECKRRNLITIITIVCGFLFLIGGIAILNQLNF